MAINLTVADLKSGITRVIKETAHALEREKLHNNKAWTNRLFEGLHMYASSLGFQVWTKKNSEDPTLSGWLYDFTLTEGTTVGSDIDIHRVWVALESEWSPRFIEIKYDFYKLMQSRSLLRVMLFQSRNVDATINSLIQIVDSSTMSLLGDQYLLVGWNDDDGFQFTPYVKE